MARFIKFSPHKVALVALLMFSLVTNPALAKSPMKLQKWMGAIDFGAKGASPFTLEGTASHLGKFTAYGEVDFVPGEDEGTLVGEGVIVFEAANGDLLVGVVSWLHDEEGPSQLHNIKWRDSVELSDGSVVYSTGRFADAQDRPPGVVTIEYLLVATIIGLGLIVGVSTL